MSTRGPSQEGRNVAASGASQGYQQAAQQPQYESQSAYSSSQGRATPGSTVFGTPGNGAEVAKQPSSIDDSINSAKGIGPHKDAENAALGPYREEEFKNFKDVKRPDRTPWCMYTKQNEQKASELGVSIYNTNLCIQFYCNPTQYSFDLPFRQVASKAKGGIVLHTFRDIHRANTNLDFGTLTITFESGSIIPRRYYDSNRKLTEERGLPEGLANYYNYLSMVQQDKVYRNKEGVIEPNYLVIEMSTPAFPKMILNLYPLDKVGVGENADTVGELTDWTGNFQIISTIPSIYNGNGDSLLYRVLNSNYKNNI